MANRKWQKLKTGPHCDKMQDEFFAAVADGDHCQARDIGNQARYFNRCRWAARGWRQLKVQRERCAWEKTKRGYRRLVIADVARRNRYGAWPQR